MEDCKRSLLSCDELEMHSSESDGISSGYESNSDVGEFKMVNKFTKSRDKKKSRAELMRFKSTNALCDNLKLILTMPELCDVTFHVGEKKVPIHGVRAILGTRSMVFYQLILKQLRTTPSGELVIQVKKYDANVFRKLIEFVHCGAVDIAIDSVVGLYCAAEQFRFGDLGNACSDYIDRCLKSGLHAEILDRSREYSHHRATSSLLSKIQSYACKSESQVRKMQE